MFNIDPKKMNAMMKQMGINQEDIPAERVIIEKTDSSKIIIENPSVVKIKMQGNESFQISGDIREEQEEEEDTSESDIQTIMEKTGCTKKQAEDSLKKTGDLADAILALS